MANLKHLEELGLVGPMGFYEAIDFTRAAKRQGERGVIIYAYMAHHQGMSLLALDNTVHRGVMQRRFHADLRIRAIESVLFERIPLTHSSLEKNTSATLASPSVDRRRARGAHLEGDECRPARPLLRKRPLFAHGDGFRRQL